MQINFVEPKVEIKYPWNYTNVENKYDSFLKQIEECGRICYQSFDKITEKSAFKFVPRVIKRKHWSVTELGTLDIIVSNRFFENQSFIFMFDDCFIHHSKLEWGDDDNETPTLLHTSLREIYAVFDKLYKEGAHDALRMVMESIYLDRDIHQYKVMPHMILEDLIPQLNDEKKFIKIDPTKEENKKITRFVTKFRSHLNFTHQLVRHRKPSYLQLSRRYVRVEENLDVIDPTKVYKNFTKKELHDYEMTIIECLKTYKKLIKEHKPEVARIILPTGIMTEIIVLEYLPGWEWIWNQRCSNYADEMMRFMMNLQLDKLKEDIKYVRKS